MRTLSQIDAEIAKVSAELQDVHGQEAEVYTRIVGYYRSVRNWNKGKREEYGIRKLFQADEDFLKNHSTTAVKENTLATTEFCFENAQIAKIEVYIKENCPNCPAVVEYCKDKKLNVTEYNVETKNGLENAIKNEVRSAPTVICYDKNNTEITRFYSVADLQNAF